MTWITEKPQALERERKGRPSAKLAEGTGQTRDIVTEKPQALERKREGRPSAKLAEGRVRDIVTKAVGMSHATYENAKEIARLLFRRRPPAT